MKHKLMVSIAALSTIAVSCGGETEVVYLPATEPPVEATEAPTTTRPVPRTTDAPIAVAPSESDYYDADVAMFMSGIELAYEYPILVSDEELLMAGLATCEMLRAGGTSDDLVTSIGNASDWSETRAEFIIIVASSAVANLCPDQGYKFGI